MAVPLAVGNKIPAQLEESCQLTEREVPSSGGPQGLSNLLTQGHRFFPLWWF